MKLEEKQVRNLERILGTIGGVCRESRLAIGSQLGAAAGAQVMTADSVLWCREQWSVAGFWSCVGWSCRPSPWVLPVASPSLPLC